MAYMCGWRISMDGEWRMEKLHHEGAEHAKEKKSFTAKTPGTPRIFYKNQKAIRLWSPVTGHRSLSRRDVENAERNELNLVGDKRRRV